MAGAPGRIFEPVVDQNPRMVPSPPVAQLRLADLLLVQRLAEVFGVAMTSGQAIDAALLVAKHRTEKSPGTFAPGL